MRQDFEKGLQHLSEHEVEDPVPLEDFGEESPFDWMAERFGAAPWWLISGSFHALLMLLITLIGVALIQSPDPKVVLEFFPDPPPQYDPPPKIPLAFQTQQPEVPLEPVLTQVLLVDEIEAETPEVPDEIDEDFHDPVGDQGLMDVDTGSLNSFSRAMGLNSGGADRFGRPDGRGARLYRARKGGGGELTEKTLDHALKWLADHQEADGHWDCVKYDGKKADVGATGLALLAFLGHGETEKTGEFRNTVQRAVQWLKKIQQEDGKFFIEGETHGVGYHHAIAGLAMAEAAGMAKIPDTIKSAQRAINYSVEKHQKGEGSERSGWRYQAQSNVCDLSVSGWFIMQLKSAKVAGLKVDPLAFNGAISFLDSVERKGDAGDPYGGHRYGYTPDGKQGVSYRRTAIGCLSRQFLGWKSEALCGGIEWFVAQGGVPEWGANGGKVDLYYWYYATLCLFQNGGDLWKRWNAAMIRTLVDNQRLDGDEKGSWDPVGDYAGYWGRVGQTALGALCLEVYYRYAVMLNE